MAEVERIYLPAWVKPTAALALTLLSAGAGAGWVAASYASSTQEQLREIRAALRNTDRELCAIRAGLKLNGYSYVCNESGGVSSSAGVGASLGPAPLFEREAGNVTDRR